MEKEAGSRSSRRKRQLPERLAIEDPSHEKQMRAAMALSLRSNGAPPRRPIKRTKKAEPRRSVSPVPKEEEDKVELEATKYIGVLRCLATGHYRASVSRKNNRTQIPLGVFATPIEAAVAADEAARRIHGNEVQTNFPPPSGLPLFTAPLNTTKTPTKEKRCRPPTWYEAELEPLFLDSSTSFSS